MSMRGMRRSALKESLLRALRSQISSASANPPTQLDATTPPTHFNSFSILPRLGQRWVRLLRSDHREHIQIDATMVDGHADAPPTPRAPSGSRSSTLLSSSSSNANSNSNSISISDVPVPVPVPRLHITLAVEVSRKDSHSDDTSVMQFLCSAWPDALDVDRVFAAPRPIRAIKPYLGPPFKVLDEEMKNAVHDYLDERGVNDDLAAFLHYYTAHKDQTEHIRWLTNIHSYLSR